MGGRIPLLAFSPGYADYSRAQATHSSGYLYLNPAFTWVNGSQDINANKADVQTVAVHEVGHFVGLAHPWSPHCTDGTAFTSAEQSSVMNAIATGTRRSLNSDDLAGVAALY